jgi:hypothetical protein
MHLFRLLRRRESPAMRAEPRAFIAGHAHSRTGTGMPEPDGDPLAMFREEQPEEDLRGSGAIFGLIGSRPAMEDGAVSRTSGRDDTDDLISSLHRQYCQALANPLGPVAGTDWESSSESSGRYVRGESALPPDPHLRDGSQDSIEALLSGAQLLDHAFGPLRESDLGSLPETEPVPEILRLFAPPEYLASAFRSMSALPPTLARRDHHSLGIDSPLPMPEVTLTGISS